MTFRNDGYVCILSIKTNVVKSFINTNEHNKNRNRKRNPQVLT